MRLNAATQIANSLNTFTEISGTMIAPSIAWQPLPGVKLTAEYTYSKSEQPSRLAESRRNYLRLLEMPLRFKTTDYGSYLRDHSNTFHGEASWEITPTLSLRQGVYCNRNSEDEVAIPGYDHDIVGDLLTRDQRSDTATARDFSSQTELRWTVNIGPTRHKLLVGFEHASQRYGCPFDVDQPFPSLALNNPVYGYPVQPSIYGPVTVLCRPLISLCHFGLESERADASQKPLLRFVNFASAAQFSIRPL